MSGCKTLGRLLPPPPNLTLRFTCLSATCRIGTSALRRSDFSTRIAALAFACRAKGIEPDSARRTAELVPAGHPVAMRNPVLSLACTCPTTEEGAKVAQQEAAYRATGSTYALCTASRSFTRLPHSFPLMRRRRLVRRAIRLPRSLEWWLKPSWLSRFTPRKTG